MERDPTITAKMGALFSAAQLTAADDVLRRLGRHLMAKTPLVEGIGPYEDPEEVPDITANSEIDSQLIFSSPEHHLFADESERLELFSQAWGEGIDEIIFSTGEADEYHAEILFDEFMEYAKKYAVPIESPANLDDKQFREWLCTDFVGYIRRWRAQVFDLLASGTTLPDV